MQRTQLPNGVCWICPSCNGRAVGMGLLRRTLEPDFVRALWRTTVERGQTGGVACPICEQEMLRSGTEVALDICKRCQFAWFDPEEFEAVPHVVAPSEPELSQEQLEAIGRLEAAQVAWLWRRSPSGEIVPDLSVVPAALGMPIEEEAPVVQGIPWLTWVIAIAITVANIVVGASWFQLGTNLYFLFVFGDNVEDFLGHLNYALLLGVAGLAGGGAHALFSSQVGIPLAGIGAAISGIIVFYGLRFPQARLRYFRLFRWLTMPAAAATGFWFVTQLLGARDELTGSSDISYIAHLGGAAIGLWFWFLWRHDPSGVTGVLKSAPSHAQEG